MLITGTPEVKTAVEINLVIDDVYVTVGGKTYYPIVWTYNDEDYNGSEVATMITKVKENNKTYAANADLGDIDATISWAWAFENTALDSNANDYDTILGDMSAKEVEELETKLGLAQGNTELSVQFTASVTQVQ